MTTRNQPVLESLVVAMLARVEREGKHAIDDLCREHPEHATALRARHAKLVEFGLFDDPRTRVDAKASRPAGEHAKGALEFGNYVPIALLGRGGMGEVWLAEQTHPVRRRVALKRILAQGLGSEEVLARFELERQALARLRHDGIAKVYDAGTAADGSPYFAMEHVDGQTLDRWCDDHRLDLFRRIELIAKVCDAIQHAHQNGVLHRDLKPTNVLVTEQDGQPVPKVIDFGLARALDDPLTERAYRTEAGQILGTPSYMSPEQANGSDEVDTRADVYALGVMLHEVLTSRHPLELETADGIFGMLRAIGEKQPIRVSRHAARLEGRALEVRALNKPRHAVLVLRGDLERILLAAQAKDPAERYASVGALAEDLRRFLRHEPIGLVPPSISYVAGKFLRRHRAVFVTISIVLVSLGATGLVTLSSLSRLAESGRRIQELGSMHVLEGLRDEATESLLPVEPGAIHDVGRVERWFEHLARLEPDVEAGRAKVEALEASDDELAIEEVVVRDALRKLVDIAEELSKAGGVRERLELARAWSAQVERATLDEPAGLWRTAIASIADPEQCPPYEGLVVRPQLGLVPLRRNPTTRLWEFRVWTPMGETPEFSTEHDGLVNPATADPVVVLLPGGAFRMGSQIEDANAGNYYAGAPLTEEPVHTVTLDPFFVGKYEIGLGHWKRWCQDPQVERQARYFASLEKNAGEHWPLSGRTRDQLRSVLRTYGLDLLTEAQWEYAARGGTSTAWFWGGDPEDLETVRLRANLSDRTAQRRGAMSQAYLPIDDGWAFPARIDAMKPNPFGLHHVLGNLWEWVCDDNQLVYPSDTDTKNLHRPGDGLLTGGNPREGICRGGSYRSLLNFSRPAMRLMRAASTANDETTGRIARRLVR